MTLEEEKKIAYQKPIRGTQITILLLNGHGGYGIEGLSWRVMDNGQMIPDGWDWPEAAVQEIKRLTGELQDLGFSQQMIGMLGNLKQGIIMHGEWKQNSRVWPRTSENFQKEKFQEALESLGFTETRAQENHRPRRSRSNAGKQAESRSR